MNIAEFVEKFRARINDPNSYRDLPKEMDAKDCMPAKYYPIQWLIDDLTALLAQREAEVREEYKSLLEVATVIAKKKYEAIRAEKGAS